MLQAQVGYHLKRRREEEEEEEEDAQGQN